MDCSIQSYRHSKDGIINKFVLKSNTDGVVYEASSFLIADRQRLDVCISSMAGCPFNCSVCATSNSVLSFERSLMPSEMISQFNIAANREDLPDDFTLRVGFMGNGEPFANIEAVCETIRCLTQKYRERLTEIAISTIGVNTEVGIPKLLLTSKWIDRRIKLQLSLYSLRQDVRKILLPSAPSLNEIINILDKYGEEIDLPVRYNFPLIMGVNNSTEDMSLLMNFANENKKHRRIKLSVFNEFPGCNYRGASIEEVINKYNLLKDSGLIIDLFLGNRDPEIFASCGQMRTIQNK